jgi:hypothetical protein
MKTNMKSILIALILAALPCMSKATVYFENTGTTNGWTTLWQEDGQGGLLVTNNPTYKGTNAVRCRTVFRTTYGGRYHTELRKGGEATLGMERYYGFAFYLPADWQFVNQNFNIQQFIGNASGCAGGQPITMTHIYGHELDTRITTGPDGCTRAHQYFTVTTNVTAGVWHRVVIHGKWAADNTGIFEFWFDGIRTVSQVNVPTIPNDDTVFNLAVGNYSNGWHDDGMMVGTQNIRDIYVDQIRVTDNYAEADPASWTAAGDESFVKIINRNSGKAMNVEGSSTANGAQIIQWPYTADTNQNDEWQIVDIDAGYSKILNRKSGKGLNVSGSAITDGAPVIQWTYTDDSIRNDEWQVVDIGSGFCKILNRNSGKALNVEGVSTNDGARVIQWTYSNNASRNDEWQVITVP